MSQPPFSSAALRGAVDLSGLGARPAAPGAGRPATGPGAARQEGPPGGHVPAGAGASTLGLVGGVPGRTGALVEADDATFEAVVNASLATPLVLVLWTPQVPESHAHLLELAQLAKDKDGRFQVVAVDLAVSPGIMQALTPILQQTFGQVSALPVVLGLLGGQPMPFYLGTQDMSRVDPLIDSFLEAAVTNAVTGRVDVSGPLPGPSDDAATPEEAEEDGLSAEHQAAYDAIELGDWDAAVAAYERALAVDPGDELARLGLGQVTLLRRTSRLDLASVRQAAAERPGDVQAQIEAADVDVVGGHVEDAFLRLVETVRRTSGADRDAARTHLLGLFEVVGPQDPRVAKGRSALMTALF